MSIDFTKLLQLADDTSVKFPNIIFVQLINKGTADAFYKVSTNLYQCADASKTNDVAMYVLDHKIKVTCTVSARPQVRPLIWRVK